MTLSLLAPVLIIFVNTRRLSLGALTSTLKNVYARLILTSNSILRSYELLVCLTFKFLSSNSQFGDKKFPHISVNNFQSFFNMSSNQFIDKDILN